MEIEKDEKYWLEMYNIKPCMVKLYKVESAKIRVRLTACCVTDGDVNPLQCDVQQKSLGSNTFCIKVKKSSPAKLSKMQGRREQNENTSGKLKKKETAFRDC